LTPRRRAWRWLATGLAAALTCACDGGDTKYMGAQTPFAGCDVRPTAPPPALGLPSFYGKYLDGYGTPVVSSTAVADQGLAAACRITGEMVSLRADVRAALAANHMHVAVIGAGEVTTDIPEYADLYAAFPNTDWNSLRGIGATHARPVVSAGEENLLCLPADAYAGQTILVQMLAHGLRDLGIVDVDAQFPNRLQTAYNAAMSSGLWAGTWATDSPNDYWAMGGQTWFGVNTRVPVGSRAELMTYDPALAALLSSYLPADEWHPGCY
jgi:hypothetical protein